MDYYGGGLLGLIVLILDVWALVNILGSYHSVLSKVLWSVIVLLLPVLGFIIWLILGPRAAKSRM